MRTMPPMPPLIYVIGYRGTGKSTVARLLAVRLGWTCTDADALLETRHGRTIRAIFTEEGETGFRARESAILEELSQRKQHVIATGGGVVLAQPNRDILKATGWTVWLTATAPTLWQRLQGDDTTAQRRPALAQGGLAEIEHLLQVREPLYRDCANLTLSSEDQSPEAVVDLILSHWRQWHG